MTAVNISRNMQAQLQIAQWVRNGKAPVAELQNKLSELVGYAVSVRTKLVFRASGGLITTAGASLIPASLATRTRWRFAWHTSPYARYLYTTMEIAPENGGTPTDPYCSLDINQSGAAATGYAYIHGGSSDGTYADVPVNFTGGSTIVRNVANTLALTLTPDTDYEGVFKDIGKARLHSATVWEIALDPDTTNGYPSTSRAAGTPIFDQDRQDDITMLRTQWIRGSTQLWNWHTDVDSAARTQSLSSSSGAASIVLGAITLSATGTSSALTFDAPLASGVSTIVHGNPLSLAVVATCAGGTQTNGSITVSVARQFERDAMPVTSFTDGWTESGGWVLADDLTYTNNFIRASVPVGTYNITFTYTPTYSGGGSVTVSTSIWGVPVTTEATGVGSIRNITVT